MKIVQINSLYNSGSTGKIIYDLHSYLYDRGEQSYVIYGRKAKTSDEGVYKVAGEIASKARNVLSKTFGSHFGRAFIPTCRTISLLKKLKPDVVHLHCLNGYYVNTYRLLNYLKKNNIPTVLTLHAEFMYTGGCGHSFDCERWKTGCGECPNKSWNSGTYTFGKDDSARSWKRMKKAFDGFDNLTVASVSEWLRLRAQSSPILADKKHVVVHNGLDTSIFKRYAEEEISQELKSVFDKTKPTYFHATPDFNGDIKGGRFVVELAKLLPNVKFVVAGNYDKKIKYPANIEFLGNLSNQTKLAQCYTLADVTLLTSSRETFSMVVAESLCCGTPVAGFVAGAPETITIPEFSRFVEYGNMTELKAATEELVAANFDRMRISDEAHQKYGKQIMCRQYFDIYNEKI